MGFFRRKEAPGLSEELVQRVWDVSARLKQLEGNLDERLAELSARYRRAEQSEKRLDDKRSSGPCADDQPSRRTGGYLAVRKARRERLNNASKEHVE